MNSDDRRTGHDGSRPDPLDRLLREARWPEPEPERVERLWRRWLALGRSQSRRTWMTIAAAAAVLLAILAGAWAWWHIGQTNMAKNPPQPNELSPLIEQPGLVESRPPTQYERVVSIGAARRQRPAKPQPTAPQEPRPISRAVDQLAAEPEPIVADLAAQLLRENNQQDCERELTEIIRRETGARQLAAIRLLGQAATGRSLPLLRELAKWPQTHAAAVPGVARLADPVTLAGLAQAETDERLRRELLSGLFQRGGREAVTLFLNFVLERRTTQTALESVEVVTQPPVEILFQMLHGPNYPLRLAAARVLGRLDGPVISRQLFSMVVQDVNRREALVALLSSPAGDAAHFLVDAERHTALASDIRAARSQLRTLN